MSNRPHDLAIRALAALALVSTGLLLPVGCTPATSHRADTSRATSTIDLNAKEIRQQGYRTLGLEYYPATLNEGKGVRVAVLDTGLDPASLDVTAVASADFTGSGSARDNNGHGTKVAGIIAARQNGAGLIGIAPQASLLIGKVANDDGYVKTADLIKGIDWAIAEHADVINLSLEMDKDNNTLHDAIKRAAAHGILIVASSGNAHDATAQRRVAYPARYPEAISVGMLDTQGYVSKYSFRDPRIDLYAPGEELVATYLDNKLTLDSGASFATAWASGYAALLVGESRSAHQRYDRQSILSAMRRDVQATMDSPMNDIRAVFPALALSLVLCVAFASLLTWGMLALGPARIKVLGWKRLLPLAVLGVLGMRAAIVLLRTLLLR